MDHGGVVGIKPTVLMGVGIVQRVAAVSADAGVDQKP
jgi:hypothetical protein